MPFENAVAVYVAESNTIGQLAVIYLQDRGIPAYLLEDNSLAGLTIIGPIAGIHLPKIYVNAEHADTASRLIVEFEQSQNNAAETAICYQCGASCDLGATHCPQCGETIESDDPVSAETTDTPSAYQCLADLRKVIAYAYVIPFGIIFLIFGFGLLITIIQYALN